MDITAAESAGLLQAAGGLRALAASVRDEVWLFGLGLKAPEGRSGSQRREACGSGGGGHGGREVREGDAGLQGTCGSSCGRRAAWVERRHGARGGEGARGP